MTDETEGQGEGPATQQNDTEKRARQMGWVDKDEFRGDPDKWRPADEFVERGEQHLSINRERLDNALNEIDRLKAEQADLKSDFQARIEKMDAASKKAFERQRKQLEAKYAGAKRKAAEDGDLDTYDKLNNQEREELSALDAEAKSELAEQKPDKKPKAGTITQDQQRAVDGFKSRNPWFDADPVMTAAADAYHVQLLKDRPGMTLEKNLGEVEKEMRRRFPEKFGDDDDTDDDEGYSPAEGGSRGGGGRSRKKSARDLPPEAKKAGEEFVKDGLYESIEEYAKDYFAQGEAA